jgi:hypothetical protein
MHQILSFFYSTILKSVLSSLTRNLENLNPFSPALRDQIATFSNY